MRMRTQTLVALAVVFALAAGTQVPALATITDDINPQGRFASAIDNGVAIAMANPGSKEVSGTVIVEVIVKGVSHSASARFTLGAGQNVMLPMILGTITDDINPNIVQISMIIDDANPMGK